WWIKRTGTRFSRKYRQLARAASFNVRDPWLPPVIRMVSFASRRLGVILKNSARTGRPVTSDLPGGKKRAASGKLNSARRTQRPILRLVNPGIAFGSITTNGDCFHKAASTTGPAAYPPRLNTAEA